MATLPNVASLDPISAVWANSVIAQGNAQEAAIATFKVVKLYYADFATSLHSDSGVTLPMNGVLTNASVTGRAMINFAGEVYNNDSAQQFTLIFQAVNDVVMPFSAAQPQCRIQVPNTGTVPVNQWYSYSSHTLTVPITVGNKPQINVQVYVGTPGQRWYLTCRMNVMEVAS